jgi:replicative DNA helicase
MALCSALRPEHFFSEVHRRIFEAAMSLHEAKQPVDAVQVASALRANGRLDQIGGLAYLTDLLNQAPVTSNAAAYSNTVIDCWRLRTAIHICQRGAAAGYGDVGSLNDYLSDLESAIGGMVRYAGQRVDVETNLSALQRIVRGWNENAQRVMNGERPRGIPTGIRRLDDMLSGLHARRCYLFAARPGGGKSALGLQLAAHAASLGMTAVYFSMEMPRDEQIERLLSMRSSVDNARIASGRLGYPEWQRITAAAAEVSSLPVVIDDRTYDVRQLRARALQFISEHATKKHPVGLFVVDYLQYMPGTPESRRAPRRDQIAEAARGLKELAKETGVPVVALAQLNRQIDQRGAKGEVRRPRLSDLADCSEIEKVADVVVFIHQEASVDEQGHEKYEDDQACSLLIEKVRGGGRRGSVPVRFEKPFTRFVEPSDGQRDMGAFDDI